MRTLFNCLILAVTFCLSHATNSETTEDLLKIKNHTVAVEVEVDLPWLIKFKFPLFENFEPQRFSVNLKQINRTEIQVLGFSSHNESTKWRIFRNYAPLRLSEGDMFYLQLGYMGDLRKRREDTELKKIDFNYVINNKQFDKINIVVEVLSAAQTKQSEEDDEYDCTEENTEITPRGNKNTLPDRRTTGPTMLPSMQPAWTPPVQQPMAASCTSREDQDGYTTEMLKTAEEIGQIGTRLILMGVNQSPGNTAVDVIKMFLTDKLHLPHVADKVLQARYINSKLVFELATVHAKVEVLTKARLCLVKKYRIESTELNFTDTQHY